MFSRISIPTWPPMWKEIEDSVVKLVRSEDWGRYQAESKTLLVHQLCDFFQVDHVRLTCSGSAAIEISLRAAGVKAGDQVVVAAYDYPGNFRSIELLGAKPVLVDVDLSNGSIDPESLQKIADSCDCGPVKAVVVSHLFGCPASIKRVRTICDQQGWLLIEDACQVPGMIIAGRPAGSFGDFGTLSFGGSKPLTAGNGGAVLTQSSKMLARLDSLLDRPSDTFPMAPLAAATLPPQLKRLNELCDQRTQTADYLTSQLAGSSDLPVIPLNPVTSVNPLSTLHSTKQGFQEAERGSHQDAKKQERRSFYKFAMIAPTPEKRDLYVQAANQCGLPIGIGFRALTRVSARRACKLVSLDNSQLLSERLFVLDHRALLIEPAYRESLFALLREIIQKN